jgi:gp16 family phage-associated protein
MAHECIQNASAIRSLIEESGISVAEWARANGFSSGLVYAVLDGRRKCLRGQSFRIAVALGLREGAPTSVEQLSQRLTMLKQQDANP